MEDIYFSSREQGAPPRIQDDISEASWGGIIAVYEWLLATEAFGESFPESCPDGQGCCAASRRALEMTFRAELQGFDWPPRAASVPSTELAMDFIEFCFRYVSKPIERDYHSFYRHHHLAFEQELGRVEFAKRINRLLLLGGLRFELSSTGSITRLASASLEAQFQTLSRTGEKTLDGLVDAAIKHFRSPHFSDRKTSLEKLWDAWERLKTIEDPSDKKRSISALIDRTAKNPHFREIVEVESKALTEIGNSFMIRHSEVGKYPIDDSRQLDYLFSRMFSLIYLLIGENATPRKRIDTGFPF